MAVICFIVLMGMLIAHMYAVPMNDITFLGVCIGLGLVSIAFAITSYEKK